MGNFAFYGFAIDMELEVNEHLYPKKDGLKVCYVFYHPRNFSAYYPNKSITIIEDLSHSWGTALKNRMGAVFQL